MAPTDSLLNRELKGAREREADYRRRLSRHRELALKLRLHASALRESLREQPDPNKITGLFGEAMRLSSEALGVSRAGIWLFDEGGQDLVSRLQLPNGDGSGQDRISVAACPRYISAVRASELGALAVDDVWNDPRTSELTDYLKRHGVGALLDIPIQGAGQLSGVVCHEHQGGPRVWRDEEIEFGTQVGAVVALALEGERRIVAERSARNAEAKYQDLVESLPVTVYSYELRTGQLLYLSPGIRDLGGRAAEHYLAAGGVERWLEAIEPDHREAVRRRLSAPELEPLDGELVYPIRLPDGTRRWIRDLRAVVRDARGQALVLRGTLSDVTAWKEAELARAEMEGRHRALLENIDMLAVILDGTGRVEFVNDCFSRVTGYSRTEALGADAFTLLLLPEKHREGLRSSFLDSLRQGQVVPRFETTVRTRGGRTRRILWTNTLQRSLAGEVVGSSSLGVDITDRLQAEASALEHQKLESLGRLAASVAHDFNNMLSVIAAAAADIEGGSDGARAEARGQIDLAVDQATALTGSLLAYARHETIAPILLNVDQVIAPMQPVLAALAGAQVRLSLELTAPEAQVVLDPTQLRQVVSNLVGNAADATRGCGHQVRVSTNLVTMELDQARAQDLFAEGTFLVLTVSDDGEGMEPALVDRIFDPFFTTKGKGEGTGLGLALCASIVRRAGGFISVDTTPGEGSSFQIHLPVAAQAPANDARPAPRLVPGGPPPVHGPPPSGGWCVLLVEDVEPIRNLVAGVLSARGVRVLEAPNLATARLFLAQPGIDLVLTDGRLPDGESLTLIKEIRERHQARHVVMISGSAPGSPGPAVDAVVPKPFRPDVLVETVLGLLGKSQAGGRRDPLGATPV